MIRNAPKANYWRCDGTLVACQFAGAGCAFRWSIILTCLIFTFALNFHSHFSLFTFYFYSLLSFFAFHFFHNFYFSTFTFQSYFSFALFTSSFPLSLFSFTLHFYFWFSFSNSFFQPSPTFTQQLLSLRSHKKWHSPLCHPFPANPIAISIKY